MRRLSVLACVVLAGCRGLLGIDDPTLQTSDAAQGDAAQGDGTTDGAGCLPGGADFDGDGVPDGCDLCPMYPNAQVDSDGDGIGDACDPRPTLAGDQRLLWTGFDSPSAIAQWLTLGGTWSVTGGKLVQSDAMATGRIGLPAIRSNVFLATRIDVLARGAAPQIGICAYVSTNAFKCCDVSDPSGAELMAWNAGMGITVTWNGSIAVGETLELTETASADRHDCRAAQSPAAPASASLTSTDPSGLVALHVRQAAVAYRYLFVVQMP